MHERKRPLMYRLRRAGSDLGDRIARFGAALVRPFERVSRSFGHALVSATESGDRFESGLAAIAGWLTWPFRMVGRLVAAVAGLLVPRSLRKLLVLPWQGLAWLWYRGVGSLLWLAEKLNLDVVAVWLAWLTKPIWYPLAAVGNFFVVWAATRPYKQLVWGLPAVILLLPILAAAVWGAWWGKGSVAAQYRVALRQAMDDKDYVRSALYERKLAQLGVDTQRTDFNTADALARDDKLDEAYERMQRLAPEDEPGYMPAHYWIAFRLLTDQLDVPPEEAHRLVDVHLKHLAALGIKGTQMDYMRALWELQGGNLERAAELLEPLVQSSSTAAIQRMQIDATLNRPREVRADALVVRQHMESRSRQAETLAPEEYRAWVMAEEFLGNTRRTRTVLMEYLKQNPDDEDARSDLATINLRDFNSMLRELYPDPDALAERLVDAFTLREATQEMKQQLIAIYRQHADRPSVARMFDQLAESNELPTALSETLGTAAAATGRWDQAERFLDHAVGTRPDYAVAWNNLACVLYRRPDPNYGEALDAVNRALAIAPDDHRFRETRGQIFVKLSRWHEAVADLEYAINGMPDVTAIHESLAVAYEALGEGQLAAIHRSEAE